MAKLILALVVLGLAAQSLAAPRTFVRYFPRIVGGEEVVPHSLPYQISLRYFGSHYCGGSILNENWIVTAAHCATGGASSYNVLAGVHNERFPENSSQLVPVAEVIRHENYNSGDFSNDIALMRLATPLRVSPEDNTAPIELAPSGTPIPAGEILTVSGWGTVESGGMSPSKLRAVQVPAVTDDECLNAYPGGIFESMICAGLKEGGVDSCQGDSGGPLTAVIGGKTWLVGIVSWGRGCALPDYYGVYTEASYFNEWVANKIA